MILFPYLWLGAWMDVGDLAHRFDVMKAHERRENVIRIPEGSRSAGNSYEVTVILENRRGFCGDFLPLPLFWRLYSKPVSATILITIEGPTTSSPVTQ